MSAEDGESWGKYFAAYTDDIPEFGADELDEYTLIDYELDDCMEPLVEQESMQGPSEGKGSRPRASDPQGSRQDPGGTHQGGDNAPRADVSDPRGSQDIVMTDVATGSGAVINLEGAR